MLSLLLVAALAGCLFRPLTRWVRLYLWCELGGTLLLDGARLVGISPRADLYGGLWVLVQAVVFLSAGIYAGQCLAKANHPWYVGFVALSLPIALSCLVYAVVRSGHASLPYWVWFALGRAQIQGSLGLVTACKPGLVSRTIGLLWLTQCCYQYAFAGGILFHRVQWAALNSWLPELMAIAGFGWLGIYRDARKPILD